LDVADRIRIRQGYSGTAGLWLWQSSPGDMGFIGASDDNNIGLYGAGGAGWGLLMNRISGNVILNRNYDGSRLQFQYGGNPTTNEIGMTYYTAGKVKMWLGSNLNGAGAAHLGIQQASTSGPSWVTQFDSISDLFDIGRIPAGGSYSSFLRIDNAGNVGIGTTSPGKKLDVSGDARVSGSIYLGGVPQSAWPAITVYSTTAVTGRGNTHFYYTCPSGTATACGVRKPEMESDEDVVTCYYATNYCYYSWDVSTAATSVGLDLSCTCTSSSYVTSAAMTSITIGG